MAGQHSPNLARVRGRFSCGAASAVAMKLAIGVYGDDITLENSAMGGEDPDNRRFLADCERWYGRKIEVRQSAEYVDHMDVWEKERFIKGQGGTACRGRLKDDPWAKERLPDDRLVMGFTAEEHDRADQLRSFFGIEIITPLIDAGLSKEDCFAIVQDAGIELPVSYLLGFHNANCWGCCHGGMGYWNKIREVKPDVFWRAARIQRELGTGARFWIEKDGTPIMLDELEPGRGHYPSEPRISCSIMCHIAKQDMAA